MYSLTEIPAGGCHYALSDRSPHFFCGEPVAPGKPYCVAHCRLCYAGPDKDWQALAGMMKATETTVLHARGTNLVDGRGAYRGTPQSERTQSVDEMLAGSK